MTAARRIAVLATLAALVVGCQTRPRERKSFEAPRMPRVPPRIEVPIDPALQQRAADQLAVAFASVDPISRAQSLEASSRTKDTNAIDKVLRGLDDSEGLVRFAAALCAGDLKLVGAREALERRAEDEFPSVRVAVRYALHRIGDTSRTRQLEGLSQHNDPRVRANVALVIGLLGEPTGVRIVRPMLRDLDASVRLAAAEALWSLRDEQGLRNLVAGTISRFPDEQIVCTLALAKPRDPDVKEFIVGKLAIDSDNGQYLERQLAAARALGMLNDDAGFGVAIAATTSNEPRQREMAAWALGAIGRPDAQTPLAKLLDDPQAEVKLAAATALRELALAR